MKLFTSKQMGDACEMLVAAELTLAGVPAMKAPDFWPGYDVVAQRLDGETLKISVKSRTYKHGAAFVRFNETDPFDWLAIVILPALDLNRRRIFIVPRAVVQANAMTTKAADGKITRDIQVNKVAVKFGDYENNFSLDPCGKL